jgi:transcriptional regulator with XRE-family HTH domain
MNTLNQTLKKIREERHLSQSQMAEKLDKTQSAYARIEIGDTKLDIETLQKFAEKTEMTMVDIITYPEKWVAATNIIPMPEPKVILQIELNREKKDQVLKLAFGENILEILNK